MTSIHRFLDMHQPYLLGMARNTKHEMHVALEADFPLCPERQELQNEQEEAILGIRTANSC